MAERWIIDADGTLPLVLPHAPIRSAVHVIGVETPPPAPRTAFAPRTEGGLPVNREHELRDVKLTLAIVPVRDAWTGSTHDFGAPAPEAEGEGSPAGWDGTVRRVSGGSEQVAAIEDLQQVLGGLGTSGQSVAGTLTRVWPDGRRATLDIVEVLDDGILQNRSWYAGRHTQIVITLRCLPYWRGAERLIGSGSRVAGQRLVTVDDLHVPGDVDALARIELSGATVDQRSVLYGIDQPDPTSAALGVQLDAPSLDRPTAASIAGSVAGAVSPTGCVYRPPQATDVGWTRIVSLRRSGAPLELSGTYRLWARVLCSDSRVRTRVRWSSGARESGMTSNAPRAHVGGGLQWLDLGLVTGRGVLDGAIEYSTPNAVQYNLDVLLLQPTGRSAVLQASPLPPQLEVAAVDGGIGSGDVVGSNASMGGTWVSVGSGGSGAAWTRTGFGMRRQEAASGWRAVGLPVNPAAVWALDVIMAADASGAYGADATWGVMLALGNAAGIEALASGGTAAAGAWAVGVAGRNRGFLGTQTAALWTVASGAAPVSPATSSTVIAQTWMPTLTIDGGRASLTSPGLSCALPGAMPGSGLMVALIARGGSAAWRAVRALKVSSGDAPADVALAAGRTTKIASGRATRETLAGLVGVVTPIGDRPRLPASGRTGRPVRVVVGTMRGRLDSQLDEGPNDPLDVDVYATPRWLQIPGVGA